MRLAVSLLAVSALVLAAGCAKRDEHTASADLRNASQQVDHAVADAGHNPQVHQAEADLHNAVRDAGHDLHKAETEARDAFRSISSSLHHSAHHANDPNAPDRTNG